MERRGRNMQTDFPRMKGAGKAENTGRWWREAVGVLGSRDKMGRGLLSARSSSSASRWRDTAPVSTDTCSAALSHQPTQKFASEGLTRQSWKSTSTRKRVLVSKTSHQGNIPARAKKEGSTQHTPLQDASLAASTAELVVCKGLAW